MSPEFRRSNTKVPMHLRLIPENGILQFIGLCIIVNDKTFEILSALVHNLTEELKGGKGGSIVLINALPIRHIGLSQNKDVVHVGSQ